MTRERQINAPIIVLALALVGWIVVGGLVWHENRRLAGSTECERECGATCQREDF